jgi:hypothetical protein
MNQEGQYWFFDVLFVLSSYICLASMLHAQSPKQGSITLPVRHLLNIYSFWSHVKLFHFSECWYCPFVCSLIEVSFENFLWYVSIRFALVSYHFAIKIVDASMWIVLYNLASLRFIGLVYLLHFVSWTYPLKSEKGENIPETHELREER